MKRLALYLAYLVFRVSQASLLLLTIVHGLSLATSPSVLLVFLKGNFGLEFKRLAPKVAGALNLGVLSERIPRDFCSNRGFRHSAAHPMTTQASGFPNSHSGMSTACVFVNCICLRQKQYTSHPWVRLDQNLLQPIMFLIDSTF